MTHYDNEPEQGMISFGEAFACFEQAVPGAVELGAPADVLATSASSLGALGAGLALALAANGVERGVGAADQVEAIADGARQRGWIAWR